MSPSVKPDICGLDDSRESIPCLENSPLVGIASATLAFMASTANLFLPTNVSMLNKSLPAFTVSESTLPAVSKTPPSPVKFVISVMLIPNLPTTSVKPALFNTVPTV